MAPCPLNLKKFKISFNQVKLLSRDVKPIALKFKINPEIPILHVVSTMPTNFQSNILSPGLLAVIWNSGQKL